MEYIAGILILTVGIAIAISLAKIADSLRELVITLKRFHNTYIRHRE